VPVLKKLLLIVADDDETSSLAEAISDLRRFIASCTSLKRASIASSRSARDVRRRGGQHVGVGARLAFAIVVLHAKVRSGEIP